MAEGEEVGATPRGGGSKLVPVLLVANLLMVGAVLAVVLLRGGGGKGEAAAAKPAEHAAAEASKLPGPTQKLADFVVHLRDPESDRYARVSFEVEIATEEDKTKLTAYMPRIRDAFISYLSDRTLEELRGSESIGRIKSALGERLSQQAPEVKVRGIFITDLVIQ